MKQTKHALLKELIEAIGPLLYLPAPGEDFPVTTEDEWARIYKAADLAADALGIDEQPWQKSVEAEIQRPVNALSHREMSRIALKAAFTAL